jgi:hypothetical protein
MANAETAPQKPEAAPLLERLKKVQDQADQIGPVDAPIDPKTMSDWVCDSDLTDRPDDD